MASKLSWHLQQKPGWCFDLIRNSGARYLKIIDPSSDNQFPGLRTIARTYIDDSDSNRMVAQGWLGAEQWFFRNLPIYERSPWVWAWEGPNEPPVATAAERFALREFTKHWVELMHQRAWKTVALNLSVGWPQPNTIDALGPALVDTDYLGLHEYGAPAMQDCAGDWCLRYRRTSSELRAANYRVPPILITECGIDGGVIGRPRTGWKSFATRAQYLAQLKWYDTELNNDVENDVEAAFIFTTGANSDWQNFDFDLELSQSLAAYIPTVISLPPEPPPPPPLALEFPILAWPLAESPYNVVTQEFGENPSLYAALGLVGHNGRDLAVTNYSSANPPAILATIPGESWPYQDTGYGNTVEIWYPSLKNPVLKTIYAHMIRWPSVQMGQLVQPGTILGYMGSTGNSTGPHLHYGVKPLRNNSVNPGYRGWVDPRFFMSR